MVFLGFVICVVLMFCVLEKKIIGRIGRMYGDILVMRLLRKLISVRVNILVICCCLGFGFVGMVMSW